MRDPSRSGSTQGDYEGVRNPWLPQHAPAPGQRGRSPARSPLRPTDSAHDVEVSIRRDLSFHELLDVEVVVSGKRLAVELDAVIGTRGLSELLICLVHDL